MKISLEAVRSDWERKRLIYLFGAGMISGMISMHLGKKVLLTRDRPVRPGFLVSPALHIGKQQCAFLVCMPEESKRCSSSCHFGDYLDWQPDCYNGSFLLWSGSGDVSVCSNPSLWSQGNPVSAGCYLSTVPLLYSGYCLSLCVV